MSAGLCANIKSANEIRLDSQNPSDFLYLGSYRAIIFRNPKVSMADLALSSRIAALYELQAALLEPQLKAIGINWTTFQLLSAVHGAGEEASQAEVARRLGVTPATLSETVTAHEAKGMLKRVPNAQDKRLKILQLTSKASKLLDKVLTVVNDVDQQMMRGIGVAPRDAAAKTLDRCIANLEKALR